MSKLDAILPPDTAEAALSRRSLVQTLGGAALAMTFLAGCGGSNDDNNDNNNGGGGTGASAARDADILNFALNLEYLEAEFYTYAVTGQGISSLGNIGTTGVGTEGPTTGGAKTNFVTPGYADIAAEIADDEQTHVRLLRQALGGAAIAKPAININALGLDLTDENNYIILARAFEDVGVTAYNGAAPFIQSSSILGTAASILAVEALHTGNLRLQARVKGVDGPKLDSKDVLPSQAYFANDASALAFARTPKEVLRIVLNQPTTINPTNAGGFFPNGVNGNLTRLLALGG